MNQKSLSPLAAPSEPAAVHASQLFDRFGIHAGGPWTEDALRMLEEASSQFFGMAPQNGHLWAWAESLTLRLEDIVQGGLTSKNLVRLNPKYLTTWTIVHELAHAWDAANGWRLSAWLARITGSQFNYPLFHRLFPNNQRFWYAVGNPPPPCGVDAHFNRLEDFAESVTAYLFPEEARKRADERGWGYDRFGFSQFRDTLRGRAIDQLVHQRQ